MEHMGEFEGPTLHQLPTEVLLMIFSSLRVRDLMRLRRVSKRWLRLLQHPGVWRRQRILETASEDEICRVLTFAPELQCLHVSHANSSMTSIASSLATTTCRIRELILHIRGLTMVDSLQSLLDGGHVRCLQVEVEWPRLNDASKQQQLLLMLAGATSLRALSVDTPGWQTPLELPPNFTLPPAGPPTLESLTLRECTAPLMWNNYIVQRHAATLRSITLHDSLERVQLPPLLPNLHTFSCWPFSDLLLTPFRRFIRELTIGLPEMNVAEEDIHLVCRDAMVLERLTFRQWRTDKALAFLASAVEFQEKPIQHLAFHALMTMSPRLQSLTNSMSRLPQLRTLLVSCLPPESFLDALDDSIAPSLDVLSVRLDPDVCLHSWLHRPNVEDVRSRKTGMHVTVRNVKWCGVGAMQGRPLCDFCRAGCHSLGPRPKNVVHVCPSNDECNRNHHLLVPGGYLKM